ncbi:hypothetical protein [Planococcus versutus]|uniref:hypothetical protein n=1 Tax=Planococcus versutus TaxID=1302659 RepID=UPI000ADF4593|nr:hypothetical protein [Planococcus versutus]
MKYVTLLRGVNVDAILWSVDKKQITKSGMSKISRTTLYRRITIRNVNTVRKVWSLLQ